MLCDGGYDTRGAFPHCRNRRVRAIIRIRHNATTHSRGKDRARSEAALEQLGGGCTAKQFARMKKDERNRHRKKWKDKVKFGDRWLVEIVISAFKRLLGEAVRAVKPEYILKYMATKIAVYNDAGHHDRGGGAIGRRGSRRPR